MDKKPTNKQLRDRDEAKRRRALAAKYLVQYRVWVTPDRSEEFVEAVVARFGAHAMTMTGALRHIGKYSPARRVAKKKVTRPTHSAESVPAPRDDASPKKRSAPSPSKERTQQINLEFQDDHKNS